MTPSFSIWWSVPEGPTPAQHEVLLGVLDDGERTHAGKLVDVRDRDAYVLAHALLRLMLSASVGASPRSWTFARSPGGRPELASPGIAPGLRFSLSHSRTIVACVVTHAGAIGVDVEAFGDEPPDPILLDLCCARSERELLERTDPGARGRVWTQLWTMKEAIVKALGMGLACPLQNVECALDPPRVLSVPGSRASGWEIVSVLPTARTALAFAGPPAGPGAAGVALLQISADEIVERLGAMMVRPA